MQPGSHEWERAHNAYLTPPEYDGCEDCDCEDPEHPEARADCTCGGVLYEDADHVFRCSRCGKVEDEDYEAPPCRCECHNLPMEPEGDDDPNDNGDWDNDEPYPDWLEPVESDIYDGGF